MEQQGNYKGGEGRKIAFYGLLATAVGILGYIGLDQLKKHRELKREEADPENVPALPSSVTQSFTPATTFKPKANDSFPLKQGSKGEKVKQLQQALIDKYGKAILPKYGADGDFGKEMVDSLKSKGLPETIDENTFNVLVKSRSFDARALAERIFKAISTKNFNEVIAVLKQFKSTEDYSAVSENFKFFRLNGGVRQTLVNALMNNFSGEQKQRIQMELLRAGLKFDGNKWALAGIELRKIMTIRPTLVWKNKNTAVRVPAKTILGYELDQKKGFSLFKSIHNQKFLVKTTTIKYI